MHHTRLIPLFFVAAALAIVGPALAAPQSTPGSSASAPEVALETEQAPIAATGSGLCGLTQSDVAGIVSFYDLDPDMPAVVDALSTPFNCEAYGDLCGALDPVEAHAYACNVWLDLDAHITAEEALAGANHVLRNFGQECTPDPDDCKEICGAAPVLACGGVTVYNGCKAIAMCDYFITIDFPYLEFLGPFPI